MKSWIRIHDIRTLDNYSLQEKMLQEELEAFYGRDIILADRYRYYKYSSSWRKIFIILLKILSRALQIFVKFLKQLYNFCC